jgi:uncharacterized protein (DUF433 family)
MPNLLAFTSEHVSRLTGLTLRQLVYWDRTGFFIPQLAAADRRRPFSRIYSFRDVVGLRALAELRNRHRVPLQRVRSWLAEHHETPWSGLTLYVGGQRVYFDDPRSSTRQAARVPGQTVLPFEMQRVASQIEDAAAELRQRPCEQVGKITRHRYIAHNADVLAGTRIPTSAVWNFHRAGFTAAGILREYPQLTEADIRAAIDFEEQRRRRAS